MSYSLPKMSTMIANASKAAKSVGREVLKTGRIKADDSIKKSRLSFCESCVYYRMEDDRCSHKKCGCFVKFKTWLNASKCPDGRW